MIKLFIIFLLFKLCGVVNWDWVWVLSPLWVGCTLGSIVNIIKYLICSADDGITLNYPKEEEYLHSTKNDYRGEY